MGEEEVIKPYNGSQLQKFKDCCLVDCSLQKATTIKKISHIQKKKNNFNSTQQKSIDPLLHVRFHGRCSTLKKISLKDISKT